MDNWKNDFRNGMNLLGTILVFCAFGDIFEAFVKPELEKRLRRKLTDWDRRAYLRELDKRAEFEVEKFMHRERQAMIHDLKIVHDFIWEQCQ